MKISHNLKQDTSSEKNNSQTVEIGNKTNERKQCQKQNIFNNKLERSDQKANTNTSAEMKISHNLKQDTSSEMNNTKTKIRNKTNERKQCQKQNILQTKNLQYYRKWIILTNSWNNSKTETKQMKESNVKNKRYLTII